MHNLESLFAFEGSDITDERERVDAPIRLGYAAAI